MPRTPNYDYERKERDRLKAIKKAEKQAAKAAAKERGEPSGETRPKPPRIPIETEGEVSYPRPSRSQAPRPAIL